MGLIFIASQPRSGSTYLQKLLSNNPRVNTVSEPWLMLALAPLFKPNLVTGLYNHQIAIDALKDYEGKFDELSLLSSVKNLALDFYKPLFRGYDFVIDKTPRYWEIMDELLQLFPDSKLIVLKRNPVEVATSMMRTWNLFTLEGLTPFKRDLLLAPLRMHEFCERHQYNPGVYTLQYESLISNTELEVKRLYQWLGIEFKPEYMDVKENSKHKGKYGDIFQNSSLPYEQEKSKALRALHPILKNFLKGYAHYLGHDFLKKYGNYDFSGGAQTASFRYFNLLPFPPRKVSAREAVKIKIFGLLTYMDRFFRP